MFKGSNVALITPFKDDKLDEEAQSAKISQGILKPKPKPKPSKEKEDPKTTIIFVKKVILFDINFSK